MKKIYETIDLFAGIGGIRKGFEDTSRFKTVYANDFDKFCKKTYDINFTEPFLTVEDINKVEASDIPNFDFLLGGFPCQAFSIAGYRHGFNDTKGRGNLFFRIAKMLKDKEKMGQEPMGFLLENVKNLKSHDKGRTFRIIMETLSELGYYMPEPRILNSMDYGNVPQTRERIYIVGFKNKEYAQNFVWPDPIPRTVRVTDLLNENVEEKYYYNDKPLYKKLNNYPFKEGVVYQWRRVYVRENKSGVCPTLTANMGTGGHNVPIIKDKNGVRKLTPEECARIQGFDKNFMFPQDIPDSKKYYQVGNSVTVPVLKRIAEKIVEAIETNRKTKTTFWKGQQPLYRVDLLEKDF